MVCVRACVRLCVCLWPSKVRQQNRPVEYVGAHRVTDKVTLAAAMETAGTLRAEVEATLSAAPAAQVFRRHGRVDGGSRGEHPGEEGLGSSPGRGADAFAARLRVASGNFVRAKRRGVVNGVDFMRTGEVRSVDVAGITQQLDLGSVVLVTSIGHSAAGETLNCNTYDTATAIAQAIHADKLVCMHDGPVDNGWISLNAALRRANAMDGSHSSSDEGDSDGPGTAVLSRSRGGKAGKADGEKALSKRHKAMPPRTRNFLESTVELSAELGALARAVEGSVRRAHLLDSSVEGALLLELYTRDGIGLMVSADAYQEMREATEADLDGIAELLQPLVDDGVVVERSPEQMFQMLDTWRVVEREGLIIACAALIEYPSRPGVGEVAAFTVRPSYQGRGIGDRFLARLEHEARTRGFDSLFLLTTRTADWFRVKGYSTAGLDALPTEKRARVDAMRNSQIYLKTLEDLDEVPTNEDGELINGKVNLGQGDYGL